jgi:multidrug efflux pump subunit AcrA (membrane-fusion protein)
VGVRARSKRRWVIVGVVAAVVVAAGGVGGWLLTHQTKAAAATSTLVAVTSGTVRQTVTATGTLAPTHQATLSFAVSGTVTAVDVEVGQKVSKGQTLATVDDSALEITVASATATVTSAQDQLDTLNDDDAADVQIASATAQLADAKAKLVTAQQAVADAKLTSTITGTVASVGISKGDQVGSSGSGGAGSGTGTATGTSSTTATIVVISTDSFVVNASVGSSDLAKLRKGLQAEIAPTDGATGTQIFGTVSSIGIVAESSSSGSATFPVVIAVTGKQTGLYSGGSASVTIIVKQTADVLTVPTLALHTSGSDTVVYQMVAGRQVSTPVVVGTSYGLTTQIKSGLKVGEQVVVTDVRAGIGAGRTGTNGGTGTGGGTGQFPGGGTGQLPGGLPGGGAGTGAGAGGTR